MKKGGILYNSGQLDCLNYYSKIFPKIKSFVGDRELATKTFIPEPIPPFIVHRGSKDPSLTLKDLKITPKLLKLRVGKHLHEVEKQLSEKEKLIWRYFVPRKLTQLYYACNYENPGKPFDRVFIDIDAGKGISEKKYAEAVKKLLRQIKSDKHLKELCSFKIKIFWTGASIHLYLMLNKKLPASSYEKYFGFTENTLTTKWANAIGVKAGHQRKQGKIILDTSATPSGKLARCPYSLYINSKGKLKGVSLLIKESDLNNLSKFKDLTADSALGF